MKGLISTILILVFTLSSFSQNISIKGVLVDSEAQPIENATVKLILLGSEKSNTTNVGVVSNINGEFSFSNISSGKYRLEVSHMNYELYFIELLIKEKETIDLKAITLYEQFLLLDEVIISGKKLPIKQTADKITINVSKNVLASGGTATDVLKQIPTVTVTTEGNISIRGKNDIDVLIDGKPSGIVAAQGQSFLTQLDLNTIERIEIITNPSVAKSVSGAGGAINIIMKKNTKNGFNGNFNMGFGSNEWYHFSPEVNYKTGAVNLFMNYTFRHRKRLSNNSNNRDQDILDELQNIDQIQTGERIDKRHHVEFGLDYQLNENEYITLSSNYRNRDKDDNQTRETISTINAIVIERREGNIQEPETNKGWGITSQYHSNYSERKKLSIVLDYVHSVEDEIILREEFVSTDLDGSNDVFDYQDMIASVYSQFKSLANKWSYEAALRLEVWDNKYKSQSINDTFKNGYFKFFPSLKIGYDFSDDTNAVLSFKKGVNRPSPNRLNPFPNISNAFNISIGNPELNPEIFYTIETGFNFRMKDVSISTGLFFTIYNDMIQRVTELQDNGITLTVPNNINNMYHYGLDLNFQTNIAKWMLQQIGGLLYIRSFEDDFIEASKKLVYQIKSTTDIRLTDNLDVQIFGSYNAPENTTQGEIKALYYFDTGLEYKFWDNRARISVTVTDIFDTLRERTILINEGLNIFNDSKINTRRVYATFRYKF